MPNRRALWPKKLGRSNSRFSKAGQLRLLRFESLEHRRLLAVVSLPWATAISFDQFSGGSPVAFGFGIDDGEPDNNRDGKSDASGIQKAPNFIGFTFDERFSAGTGIAETFVGDFGVEGNANVRGRIGIEYGFYVNGGTGSLIHNGNFNYEVIDDDEIRLVTSSRLDQGTLRTISPTLSTYADLVFEVSGGLGGRICAFACAGGSTSFSVNEKIPLVSINRQELNTAGRPVFVNGSPTFDGNIEILASGILGGVSSAYDQIKEAREDRARGEIEEQEAMQRRMMATTPSEMDEANRDIQAARDKQASGRTRESDINRASGSSGRSFGGGQVVQVSFGPSSAGLLGVEATVGVGVGVRGVANISRDLGSLSLTLPEVNLRGTTSDANRPIVASTSDFSFDSSKRRLANLNLSLGGILGSALGLGTTSISAGPFSGSLTTFDYLVDTALKVNQRVGAATTSELITVDFFDAETLASVVVDATVGSSSRTGVSRLSFAPGTDVVIRPRNGRPIQVRPSIDHEYRFTNDIGLDIDVDGTIEALKVVLGAFGESLQIGPLISNTHDLLDFDLGSIFNNSFIVDPPPSMFEPFIIGVPKVDLAITEVGSTETVELGDRLDYELSVENLGTLRSSDARVTGRLPTGTSFNAAASDSRCTGSGVSFTCNIGEVFPAGRTEPITLSADVGDGPTTRLAMFSVTSDEVELDRSNNELEIVSSEANPQRFVVTSEADDNGPNTLRAKLAEAEANPGPDTVVLGPDVRTVRLTQGPIFVDRDVTIIGTEPNRSVASCLPFSSCKRILGSGDDSVFVFGGEGPRNYEIVAVEVNGGTGPNAAIVLDAPFGRENSLTLAEVFMLRGADGPEQGTAIQTTGGRLQVNNSRIDKTRSSLNSNGRAIRSDRTDVSIFRSVFVDNQSNSPGGAISVSEGSLSIVGSAFKDNRSTVNSAGGAIQAFRANVNIDQSDFTGNDARIGGAIDIVTAVNSVDATIERSLFTENSAETGAAIFARAIFLVAMRTSICNSAT